jgi:hypothetical protein
MTDAYLSGAGQERNMRAILIVVAALTLAACGESEADKAQTRADQALVDDYVRRGEITPAEGQWVMETVKAKRKAARRERAAEAVAGIGGAVGSGMSAYGAAYTQTYSQYQPTTVRRIGNGNSYMVY